MPAKLPGGGAPFHFTHTHARTRPCSGSRSCKLISAVVGARDDETLLFNFDNKQGAEATPPTAMQTVSLGRLLRDFHAPAVIDYLSLDIEGAEAFVFSTFPWDEFTFENTRSSNN